MKVLKPISLFFLFFSVGLFSQELPPIQNFSPAEYGAGNQNWSLSQSDDKYIYAANNDGLLEFNGINWKLYNSPNGTPLRSVKVIDELIYIGCYMEFGYWKRDEYGSLKYSSISNKLQKPLVEDESFWNISKFKDWVLFQSLDRIYIYNTINESFDVLEAKTTRAEILKVGNRAYFQKIGKGVFTIENGKSILVSNDAVLKNDIVVGAFSVNKSTLLVTEQAEFYFLDESGLKRWNIPADNELSLIKVYSSLRLNDGSFVLGTISNGIYHLDDNGNIIRRINQKKGLNNNTVLSMFQDVDQNLWLGLDNGLSVMNLDSPFNEYIDKIGKMGVVYVAILFNDFMYLGTNQGLFYKKEDDDGDFKLIENTQGQVWMLKQIDGTLFCGHNSGTFIIERDKAKKIANLPGTWDIQPIKNNSNLLLQGNYKGLNVLERIDGQWRYRNKIEGFDSSSRFFEFVNEQRILVNHDYKGVFDLKIDSAFKKVLEIKKEASKGTGSSLVNYKDEIIYTTVNGVFKFDEKRHFVLDSLLTSQFFNVDDSIIGVLTPTDNSEKLWGFTDENIVYIAPGQLNDKPQAIRIPIPKFFRRSIGVLGFESITNLKDETYLIGISNGYVTLDLNRLKTKEHNVSLNSVYKEYYDAPKKEVSLTGNNEFKFSENNFNFSYSVPEYDKYTEVNYQYKLYGFYDEWSTWSTTPEVSFKNLSYGDYTFYVRAKVGNNLSKNISTFEFQIARPWYLSYFAILLYGVFVFLISVLIHRLYKAYYKKQQDLLLKENRKRLKRKKLKAQKKLVQIKNEKLQSDIDSKNRELAVSTMSLIKKNEFLNAIKKQLKNVVVEGPQIKSVIRTIDRNIANEDDWKFFEDAFNNADKDFLKKVKNLHPELTANDLRLCAYLRLNLSSKEIAPLLNISLRSVEVKRYRLRKKMNLLHEEGLADYIMQL